MMTKTEAEAIASLVHALRPDWDQRGIMTALAQCREKPPFSVALAALRAARIPANRTPAVIALGGFHWQEPGQTATPPTAVKCRRCGWIHGAVAECRAIDPDAATRGAAAARALLRASRAAQADRDAKDRARKAPADPPGATETREQPQAGVPGPPNPPQAIVSRFGEETA